jgi:hypothetical protein
MSPVQQFNEICLFQYTRHFSNVPHRPPNQFITNRIVSDLDDLNEKYENEGWK